MCIGTLEEVKKLTESVKAAVSDAYEAKAMENGQITLEQMKTIFSAYEMEIKSYVKDQITLLRQEIPLQTHQEQAPAEGTVDDFGVPFADGELDEPQAQTHGSDSYKPQPGLLH